MGGQPSCFFFVVVGKAANPRTMGKYTIATPPMISPTQ
jgi:hypothetical protein